VDITDDEANLLIEHTKEEGILIDKAHLEKQKDKTVKTWGELKYADRKCVFLDDQSSCKVYKYRPISCRVLQVVTPPSFCDAESGSQQVASFSILEVDVMATGVSNATRLDSMAKLLIEKIK
jgi:Fe-S-cluster containining protein